MKIFKDRKSAGKLLAERLKGIKADLVLGIPRGGVVVAAEVAKKLNLPLDIIVTRKIGAPGQPELALGALDPDGEVVWDENLLNQFEISNLKFKIEDEWKELKRREDLYRQGRGELKIHDKRVILIDDGIATGATTMAALKFLKRNKANVILAVPVAPAESIEELEEFADRIEVLNIPEVMGAVGQFYQQFLPVSDKEVVQLLS